jgi:DNA invertase Pin-like site-specific DNA recombinase
MKSNSADSVPPVAYSYVRFSSPEQAQGDSLRRQAKAAAEWCERNRVSLDASTTLHDLGKSAYTGAHRKNPDRHALAAFLKLVEAGKVPPGSYLVVENLDRLSREEEVPACHLLTGILMAGVRVVQLKPSELTLTDKSSGFDIMRAVMELSRGHGESAIKSDRLSSAWAEKKRRARAGETQKETRRMGTGCRAMTRQLPAWVEERGGKLVAVPTRAAAVRRIFALAAGGYGHAAIVKRLIKEGVPPIGRSGRWGRSYIANILVDRRAVGELQPHNKRTGEPDGAPVPGYYPAVVSEEDWLAARAGAAQREKKPGRMGSHINVFAGLIRNALDGDAYFSVTRSRSTPGSRGRTQRVLINQDANEGRTRARSFPAEVFDRAVFSCLQEIDPHEILNGDQGPDESLVLAGELARTEAKIAELEAELLNGDVAALARVLREQEARKRDLDAKLAVARQKAAHPLSEVWGQARGLLKALDAATDQQDARLRLRSALRRMVEVVYLLVVPRGHDRLAAAQVWFAGGQRHRDYLILHRPAKSNGKAQQEGGWRAWSLPPELATGPVDLRDRRYARALAGRLEALDLARLPADG